jgi:hypothetical protein
MGDGDSGWTLTAHASNALAERGIDPSWVARVLAAPTRVDVDRSDPTLRHAFGPVPEREHRILRVVYRPGSERALPSVVTAFLDRAETRSTRR